MECYARGLHRRDRVGQFRGPERVGADHRPHTIDICRPILRERWPSEERYESDTDQEQWPGAIEYVWGRHTDNVCPPSRRATSVTFDSAATGLPAGIVYT